MRTARVQYSHPQRGINKTVAMSPPRSMTKPDAWLRAARKALPEIPGNWYAPEPIVTGDTVIFELIDRATHERCAVVIDRGKY